MNQDMQATAVSLAKEADGRRDGLVRARRIPADPFKRSAEAGRRAHKNTAIPEGVTPTLGGVP
jgi:hypothetical protein